MALPWENDKSALAEIKMKFREILVDLILDKLKTKI